MDPIERKVPEFSFRFGRWVKLFLKPSKSWMFKGSNEGNSMQRRSKNFRKLMDTAHSRYSRCRENPAISLHSEKLEVKVNVPVVLQLLISAFP